MAAFVGCWALLVWQRRQLRNWHGDELGHFIQGTIRDLFVSSLFFGGFARSLSHIRAVAATTPEQDLTLFRKRFQRGSGTTSFPIRRIVSHSFSFFETPSAP